MAFKKRVRCPWCFTGIDTFYDHEIDIWYKKCRTDDCLYKIDIELSAHMLKQKSRKYQRKKIP